MQHQVPQFIDIEDKIFGPLTAKQFFYVLGGAALIFLMYIYFQLWLVILLGAPVAAFAGALAFLKINGQPFIKVLGSALNFASSSRLYLWRKIPLEARRQESAAAAKGGLPLTGPRLTQSKLQDLSWSLDIQEKIKR
ncbi:hypothetical protein A2661_02215 [Candidatus Giovannonibacteria bacterium RIFCSPHIGHO2_01_FULL_45_24]|nr:MAG: hypothetical protein A2661_02215 [Candidatus Giovannonibacteria bacterium RIFCSPHIGHO2_01_FULL_45_24]